MASCIGFRVLSSSVDVDRRGSTMVRFRKQCSCWEGLSEVGSNSTPVCYFSPSANSLCRWETFAQGRSFLAHASAPSLLQLLPFLPWLCRGNLVARETYAVKVLRTNTHHACFTTVVFVRRESTRILPATHKNFDPHVYACSPPYTYTSKYETSCLYICQSALRC